MLPPGDNFWLCWWIFFFLPILKFLFEICLPKVNFMFLWQLWMLCDVLYFLDVTACNTIHFTKMKWVNNKIIILNVSRAPHMVTWFCLLYKPTTAYLVISPVISFSTRGKSKLHHVMLGLWRIVRSVALTAILRMVRIRCMGHEFPSVGATGQKVVNTS